VSDIPSRLSRWEPSRAVKVGFLLLAAASVLSLFGAKLYTAAVVWPARVEQSIRAEKRSDPAVPFSLGDLAGESLSLESLRGKVVFVNFWATWCAPCREEMPSLAALARSVDARDAVFLAISVDETLEPVREFLGPGAQPFRVLHDPGGEVARRWGTDKFPESFVIDRDGTVRYKFAGARDWAGPAAVKLLERVGARRLPAPPLKS
jgi:thiol-disulfide isomerase/thioredoxin